MTEQEWFEKDRFMCFRSLDMIGLDYLDVDFGRRNVAAEMMGGFRKTPFYMEYIPDEILDSGRFRILFTIKSWLRSGLLVSKIKKYNEMLYIRCSKNWGIVLLNCTWTNGLESIAISSVGLMIHQKNLCISPCMFSRK